MTSIMKILATLTLLIEALKCLWHNPHLVVLDVRGGKEGSLVSHTENFNDAAVAASPQPAVTTPPPLSDDLLWGAEAISKFIGVNRRRTFYYLESGSLPGVKVGGVWVASRERLRKRLQDEAA